MSKRFVLSGYYGFNNFGDEAILSVLVNKLQSEKHRITIVSSNPQVTKSKFKHIRSVYTFNIYDIIGFIAKSDCLISGGGSLLQDTTSLKSLIYYLFIIFIALIFQKKVIIFAQGIGPINSYFGKLLTRNILKKCSYISVRDIKSQNLLKSWGIKSDLVCDPIFSTQLNLTNSSNDSVGVQLRNCKNMTEDFIDRLAYKVSKIFGDKKINIFPLQPAMDDEVCKNFEKSLKLLNPQIKTQIFYNLSNDEIIENISKVQYLISMRFHAIIIGIISGVKTMGINYDIKIEKICKEYNLPYIDLEKNFEDEFDDLIKLNSENIKQMAENTKFDWNGFDLILKNL